MYSADGVKRLDLQIHNGGVANLKEVEVCLVGACTLNIGDAKTINTRYGQSELTFGSLLLIPT